MRGAALCASGPAPCGVSWASTRCRTASGARPRRHGDTGPSAATHHQPPPLGRPSPTLLPAAGVRPFKLGAGAPVGPARAHLYTGRPGSARACHSPAAPSSSPTHSATGPLTSARRARNVTRRRLGRGRARWPQAGRWGPSGAGRAARATDHGLIATSSLRSRTRQYVTVSADHARAAREPVKPCTRCKHPALDIFLGRQLAEFLAPSSLIFSPYCSISPPSKLGNCSAG